VNLLPGIKDLLFELRGRYSMGLIGNQPLVVRRRLEEEGLIELFPIQALSSEMGMRKPDLRFFLSALAMAGCAADEAVMIGDRLDNDIFPARMLGMTTVRLKMGPHRHQPVLSPEFLPHYTVSNPRELAALLTSETLVSRTGGGELVW
jgi:FMN phosphatase YigB (HAD superfamily)